MRSISDIFPIGPADVSHHRGARRRATRYPLHADVRVLSPRGLEGVVLNASAGGLRVTLDGAVAEGERIALEVSIPGEPAHRDEAVVVWSRELADGWLVGLQFVEAKSA